MFISPILESITHQSINPCREVRTVAISLLQRLLLLPDLLPPQSPETAYWPEVVFDKSLLHLIDELLRPATFTSDKRGMGETRVIAQGLLCKIFLHCLTRLTEEDAAWNTRVVLTIWSDILDILIRLVGSGQKDAVVVPNSWKNTDLLGGSGAGVAEECLVGHDCTGSPCPTEFWRW
jgi:golgi-specific brefeldin A-resistance guanine nucleotide exchange factor 1